MKEILGKLTRPAIGAAALTLMGAGILAAPAAQAATAPTNIASNVCSGTTCSASLTSSVTDTSTLVLTWSSKEGQNATPVDPTSTNSDYTVVSRETFVYDNSGSTRGQIGKIVLTCAVPTCTSSPSLSFGSQSQTETEVSLDKYGVGDTVGAALYNGSSTNGTVHYSSSPTTYVSSEVTVVAAAHEANEVASPWVSLWGINPTTPTVNTLSQKNSNGNNSLYVGYFTGEASYTPGNSGGDLGGSWSTSVPGAAITFVVS